MSDKPIPFRKDQPVAPPPDVELIKFCEQLLAQARTGEVRAVAYVRLLDNGRMGSGWVGSGDNRLLHSGVTTLGTRMTADIMARLEDGGGPDDCR